MNLNLCVGRNESLLIGYHADYKYQPNKIYTLKSVKKHALQLHVNTTHL